MASKNAAERRRIARIGGLYRALRRPPDENLSKARTAFEARFERQVDPDGTLPPTERARRAEIARKIYFTELSLAAARARRKAES